MPAGVMPEAPITHQLDASRPVKRTILQHARPSILLVHPQDHLHDANRLCIGRTHGRSPRRPCRGRYARCAGSDRFAGAARAALRYARFSAAHCKARKSYATFPFYIFVALMAAMIRRAACGMIPGARSRCMRGCWMSVVRAFPKDTLRSVTRVTRYFLAHAQ